MTTAFKNATQFLKEFQELLEKHQVSIDLESDYESTIVQGTVYSAGYYVSEDDHYSGFDIPLKIVNNELTLDIQFDVDLEK